MKSKTVFAKTKILLVVIIVLGLLLRVYHINVPFSGHQSLKEAQFASMAKMMIKEGGYFTAKTHWMGPNNNVFFPAWFIIASWRIFGESEWAARVPFVILGLASIFLMYLICTELKDKKTGLIAAFFAAISPMMVYFSRNVQGESPLIFFSLLVVYFLILYKRKGDFLQLILCAVSLTLAAMSKTNALYLVIFAFLYWLKYKKQMNINFFKVFTAIMIGVVPTIIYIIHTSSLPNKLYSFSQRMTNLSAILDLKEMIFRAFYLVGGVNLIVFCLFLVFIYYLFKNSKFNSIEELDFVIISLIISYSIFYFSFLNIAHVGNNYYLVPFIPPIIFGAAKVTKELLTKKMLIGLIISISLLVSVISLFFIYNIRYPYYETGIKLSEIMNENSTLYRLGDPAVCYYANNFCLIKNDYDIKTADYELLSVTSTNFNKLNEETKKYVKENFELLDTIKGPKNFFSGTYVKKNDVPVEYMFVRKTKKI
ncbi:MAG: glycosyltransferase family 39 protein [Nanoarchaeota archaeon]|nr:glycosyltransferase family 39 protein [Nanoarchaeota archaeon]MBU1030835.1 glycosyltransferase family 39 protein [Nanoarchaeota archaeon]MBU1849703.1 glycosyltransferase family 39 protein [Nanoarchaeota archaeon]